MDRLEVNPLLLDFFGVPERDRPEPAALLSVLLSRQSDNCFLIKPQPQSLKPFTGVVRYFPADDDDWDDKPKADEMVRIYGTFIEAERNSLTAGELNNLACFFFWQSNPSVAKLKEFLDRAKNKVAQSDPEGVTQIITDNLGQIKMACISPPRGLPLFRRFVDTLGEEAKVFIEEFLVEDEGTR